jgi:uncharacterized membrane protein
MAFEALGFRGTAGVEGFPVSLAPLLTAPLLVQAHVVLGLAALLLGGLRLALPLRDGSDRALGWSFLVLLAATAGTAVLLARPERTPEVFGLTLGHGFILATLVGLVAAVAARGRESRVRWRNIVTALFAGVLLMAGLFEMAPGRLLNAVLAGG